MNKYAVEFIGTFFLVFTVGRCPLIPEPELWRRWRSDRRWR